MNTEAIKEAIKIGSDFLGKVMKPTSSDKTAPKVRLRFEPKNQDFILENVGDKEALNIVVEQEGDNWPNPFQDVKNIRLCNGEAITKHVPLTDCDPSDAVFEVLWMNENGDEFGDTFSFHF